MKNLLLLIGCLSLFIAKAQNGFTTYTTNLTISGGVKFQTAFLVDHNSNKWTGFRTITSGTNVANAGLLKYDNSNWTLYNQTSNPAFPSNNVTALAKDNSGNIWIGCDSGLVKFDGSVFTTFSTAQGLPVKLVKCVEVIGNQVYVATTSGLSRFDGVTFTNYNITSGSLATNSIISIKAETPNLIWLGCYDRLTQFNINSSFTTTSYIDHLGTGIINCIHIDSQNNKWLGLSYLGIVKYNGTTFQNAATLYGIYGSLIPTAIKDIAKGPHNGIIFINENGATGSANSSGLTELAPNGEVYQYFHSNLSYAFGTFLENDGTNVLVSASGPNVPKIYYSLNPSINSVPFGTVNSNNFKTLDINNVRAGIANRSDMHWDIGGTQYAMYEVPKGSGVHSNFASALWIGGLDNGGQLHGGAQTYRQSGGAGGVNFWPGPLDTINATIDTATSLNYDKIWKVSYTDINNFITAFNSGSVVATPDMLTWPAHGSGNNSRNLAPFVDYNGDGLYNPNDGDYPKIKGDQTLYFIYNDKLALHTNTFAPMGIEVQGMAYAYGCPAVTNGHNELTYTTFYDYKIINRSSTNYHDVYVSMWSDADLGYYGDDYIGSDIGDNYGYIYNADAVDESISGVAGYGSLIPAQGFNIVKGPLANPNDGIDNNNNGVIDEPGEDCKLNKYTYFNNSFAGVPLQTTDPANGQEYYNYMTGYWRDGTPFTCGGNGYGGTATSSWMCPGDPNNAGVSTDPSNTCGYWKETGVGGDRRMILSSGPFTLNAGQMQEIEYAFVTSFDSSAAPGGAMSLGKLKTDIQKINTFYNQINKPNCLQAINVGLTEVVKQNDFALFPNPARSVITISSTINGIVKINYEIVDVLGKVVLQNENTDSDKFSININDLNSGIYFLRLQVNNSVVVKKFVKE
jgi:hypothetical protein